MEEVLIIDNYDSFTYNLVHYVESVKNYKAVVYRNDAISLEKVAQYDKIILSPGPGLPEEAGILKEVISVFSSTKKILGVCLGMQAIGEVFGARLVNMETVLHGVATLIEVLDKNDVLFLDLPTRFEVGRYHSWMLSKVNFPECLTITSVDEDQRIMSCRHKDFEVYGVQFHPESILTQNGHKLVSNFLKS